MTQERFSEIKPSAEKRIENPKKRRSLSKKERLILVGLFSLTVFLCLFFYFKDKIFSFAQKINSPLVISGGKEEKKFDPAPVLEEIKLLVKDLRGKYGIYIYRFKDNQSYGIYHKEIFPAASLMKLPVILTLYQEAEAGKISLETKYKLLEADKQGGAGILQGRPAGEVYTYRKLAQLMGQYSDNTANNVLVKILGSRKIQQTINNLGMEKTNFGEYETTPEDIGIFFRQLYRGKVVTSEYQEEILQFLTKTGFEDRIPAGLPKEVKVAHKVGTEIGVFSDAGIVFPSGKDPFILVIMSKEAKEGEAKEVLPKIAKVVWEWETEGSAH